MADGRIRISDLSRISEIEYHFAPRPLGRVMVSHLESSFVVSLLSPLSKVAQP